ncbi:hypothetical protein KEM54_000399 [Ascosphaera aggregata]|nr:hypothetical protein KEM54_000399 [Ascosphaera aggregata]
MASVFTFDTEVPRVCSPWETRSAPAASRPCESTSTATGDCNGFEDVGISKLDPEPQDGATEYKLHLLLRPRRSFVHLSTDDSCRSVDSFSASPETLARRTQYSSIYSRQNRLEHLTTQLLWRLQQSSPFHSSSTRNLVVPELPDTSTKLDIPSKRAPLLPGLEESQGALYEIGVSDDGTFIGLTEAEMSESLTNLTAMAASLGCKVEVLRKVAVGNCKWERVTDNDCTETVSEKLWVVEALVSPGISDCLSAETKHTVVDERNQSTDLLETASTIPYLSVALAGPSGAGKSSLLGTMATSMLDNGRGKSRLSLLRHRHEITTGMTSSVAQELIGFRPAPNDADMIINYAQEGVTSWNDIHMAADIEKLAFVSDLPGSSRFLKSTLRGITGWHPEIVLLCVPANSCEKSPSVAGTSDLPLCLWYLDVLFKLNIPVMVVVTKLDIATKHGVRQTLSCLLSVIKKSEHKPLMLPPEGTIEDISLRTLQSEDKTSISSTVDALQKDPFTNVPLLLTSSVTGIGIRKVLSFLRLLPAQINRPIHSSAKPIVTPRKGPSDVFDVLDVFEVPTFKVFSSTDDDENSEGSVVVCGRVRRGLLSLGQTFRIGPVSVDGRVNSRHALNGKMHNGRQTVWLPVRIISARNLRLPVKSLHDNQIGTIGIESLEPSCLVSRVRKGMVLIDEASFIKEDNNIYPCTGFTASIKLVDAAGALKSVLAPRANVVVYINNVRAAAKVSQVPYDLATKCEKGPSLDVSPYANGSVSGSSGNNSQEEGEHKTIALSFSFISSPEVIEIGSSVLIMPGNMKFSSSPTSNLRSPDLPFFVGDIIDVVTE